MMVVGLWRVVLVTWIMGLMDGFQQLDGFGGSVVGAVEVIRGQDQVDESSEKAASKPYFEAATWPRNVSVVLGHPVALKCRVRLLGDRMLSWIRQRDLHVLTHATVSYTSDIRFSVHHIVPNDDWELRISSAEARDAGYYECQVNTEPKLHWPIYLQVYTAQAMIAGPSEVHVRQGSTLSVTCSLEGPQDGESALDWYHNDRRIDLENVRGAISLATERRDHFTKSRLLIPRADVHHGGNYTCVPTQALPVTVLVHVLNGEHPAAMQHGNRSGGGRRLHNVALSILCLIYWTFDHIIR